MRKLKNIETHLVPRLGPRVEAEAGAQREAQTASRCNTVVLAIAVQRDPRAAKSGSNFHRNRIYDVIYLEFAPVPKYVSTLV